jgi:hypothetical protein
MFIITIILSYKAETTHGRRTQGKQGRMRTKLYQTLNNKIKILIKHIT